MKYHLGDQLTAADIYMYETFNAINIVHPETVNSFVNIKRVAESIETLPWFESYKTSPYYVD